MKTPFEPNDPVIRECIERYYKEIQTLPGHQHTALLGQWMAYLANLAYEQGQHSERRGIEAYLAELIQGVKWGALGPSTLLDAETLIRIQSAIHHRKSLRPPELFPFR